MIKYTEIDYKEFLILQKTKKFKPLTSYIVNEINNYYFYYENNHVHNQYSAARVWNEKHLYYANRKEYLLNGEYYGSNNKDDWKSYIASDEDWAKLAPRLLKLKAFQ